MTMTSSLSNIRMWDMAYEVQEYTPGADGHQVSLTEMVENAEELYNSAPYMTWATPHSFSEWRSLEYCLSLDTLVDMADGTQKAIGDIVVSDVVQSLAIEGMPDEGNSWIKWSATEFESESSTASVVGMRTRASENYYIINGIKCTHNHPFLIRRDNLWGWATAKDIQIDDELYNGDIITQKDFIEEPLDVKTIDVETNDVYFISGILVHNK